MSPNRAHTVYLLQSPGRNAYKVGITKNLASRLKQLRASGNVDLLGSYHLGPGRAYAMEQAILRQHRGQRLPQSEWLLLEAEQVEAIRSELQRHAEAAGKARPIVTMPAAGLSPRIQHSSRVRRIQTSSWVRRRPYPTQAERRRTSLLAKRTVYRMLGLAGAACIAALALHGLLVEALLIGSVLIWPVLLLIAWFGDEK